MLLITSAAISSGRTEASMPPNAPIGVRIASTMTTSFMRFSRNYSWIDSTISKMRGNQDMYHLVDLRQNLMYSYFKISINEMEHKMPKKKIKINRAPVLTLWATVVAERLGHDQNESLTFGKAVAGLNAQSKGRRLGIYEEKKDEDKSNEKREERPAKLEV